MNRHTLTHKTLLVSSGLAPKLWMKVSEKNI